MRIPGSENNKTPRPKPWGQIGGWEFAALSFPVGDVRRSAFAGHRLPDAILRGKRRSRSHSRTVAGVSVRDLLGEASWPGSPSTCRWNVAGPGNDTPASMLSRRCRFPSGRPRFLAGRCPHVTGLTSYPSGCLSYRSWVTRFFVPPQSGGFAGIATPAHSPTLIPRYAPCFFRSLGLLTAFRPSSGSLPCRSCSSNRIPSG